MRMAHGQPLAAAIRAYYHEHVEPRLIARHGARLKTKEHMVPPTLKGFPWDEEYVEEAKSIAVYETLRDKRQSKSAADQRIHVPDRDAAGEIVHGKFTQAPLMQMNMTDLRGWEWEAERIIEGGDRTRRMAILLQGSLRLRCMDRGLDPESTLLEAVFSIAEVDTLREAA